MAAATSHSPDLSVSHGLLWLGLLLLLSGLLAGLFAFTEGFAVGAAGVALTITPAQLAVVLSALVGAGISGLFACILLLP